jgi:hypothetical protein
MKKLEISSARAHNYESRVHFIMSFFVNPQNDPPVGLDLSDTTGMRWLPKRGGAAGVGVRISPFRHVLDKIQNTFIQPPASSEGRGSTP